MRRLPVSEHLVQFYDTDDEVVDAVVPYLAAGIEANEAVLVIAPESHRLAFERQLAARGTGIEQALAAGTYIAIDALDLLRYLRPDSEAELSADEFDATVGMHIRRQLATGRRLRAYGEIVALLWDDGDVAGATTLEAMWSDLQEREQFMLFCGYPGLRSAARLNAVRHVCRSHWHVLPRITEGDPHHDAVLISAEFGPNLVSPGRVRELIRAALRDHDADDDLIERGMLAASELAANAVVHAHTSFRLLVRVLTASVWIGVEDRAPLVDRHELVGRLPHGLGMIATLALRWGVSLEPTGKVVWAEIPL